METAGGGLLARAFRRREKHQQLQILLNVVKVVRFLRGNERMDSVVIGVLALRGAEAGTPRRYVIDLFFGMRLLVVCRAGGQSVDAQAQIPRAEEFNVSLPFFPHLEQAMELHGPV